MLLSEYYGGYFACVAEILSEAVAELDSIRAKFAAAQEELVSVKASLAAKDETIALLRELIPAKEA